MSPPPPQKPTKANPSKADIITNRALLNYAEASRLAKSWLRDFPAPIGQDGQETDPDHEEEKEAAAERELLQNRDLYSETGGVGYRAPESNGAKSGTRPTAADPTTMLLRKQLLGGRNATLGQVNGGRHGASVPRPRPQQQRLGGAKRENDSDEEESRATLTRTKDRQSNRATNSTDSILSVRSTDLNTVSIGIDGEGEARHPEKQSQPSSAPNAPSRQSKKRGKSSYLDELLASRAAKKQKKSKSNPG